jgi:hypothetical protein
MKARHTTALAVITLAAAVACAPSPRRVAGPETAVPPRITAEGLAPADERAWLDTSDLVYTSDYLSFVGRDPQGFVAFALDTNRGRDGAAFQAEHYVAMHDQRRGGWIDVAGNGRFENAGRELVAIPPSPFFRYEGEIDTGLAVTSPPNGLTLEVGPMPDRALVEHDARTFFALGSAPATLRWDGRAIPGRVIHEDLVKTGFNLMTRPDVSGLKGFNGFYLLTETGGDLYHHGVNGALPGASVPPPVVGFRADAGRSETLRNLRVEETAHAPALGLYRWPTAWRATWQGPSGPVTLDLAMRSRKGMVNWLIGAYSLAVVEGKVTEAGRATPVYGWGELIR